MRIWKSELKYAGEGANVCSLEEGKPEEGMGEGQSVVATTVLSYHIHQEVESGEFVKIYQIDGHLFIWVGEKASSLCLRRPRDTDVARDPCGTNPLFRQW